MTMRVGVFYKHLRFNWSQCSVTALAVPSSLRQHCKKKKEEMLGLSKLNREDMRKKENSSQEDDKVNQKLA